MLPLARLRSFGTDESGGILVFWGVALVVILGLAAVVVDSGRLVSTQSELQSYADSVALAAAAELDGRADALTRAQTAASTLITDSQTFGAGGSALTGEQISLTYYRIDANGGFSRDPGLVTTNPYNARYVSANLAERTVSLPFSAAMAAVGGSAEVDDTVAASAVASFSVDACDVTPIAMCLPSLDFSAEASIGSSLSLRTAGSAELMLPGDMIAVDTLSGLLDGLEVCAGLLGNALNACLIAAQEPPSACGGGGGLSIAANVDGNDLLDAVNARFGEFQGLVAGLAGNSDFPVAPGLLDGLLAPAGLCLPNPLSAGEDRSLPLDDCFASGTCAIQGSGSWSAGRTAYVAAHYDGTDPFPEAETRFEFYQAEVAAGIGPARPAPNPIGSLIGTVTSTVLPQLCVPETEADETRRLMVVAGIDCSALLANGNTPPVREYFEVFVLGPARDGVLNVEISACLGGGCGTGALDTEILDVVRLVE